MMWNGTPRSARYCGQHVLGKIRLLLVEIDRHQLEAHGRLRLQRQQHVEQGVGILAAGQADHDLVALPDHAEVGDGLAHLAAQALGQLGGFVGLFTGGVGRGGHRRGLGRTGGPLL
jgi:hypothetical protein